jgi:hypothetical protein
MAVQFLFWTDYLLLPVYLLLTFVFLNRYFRKKHGHNDALKKHFNRGILLKLVGCIAIALIYQYYYGGAYDGISYFEGAKMLNKYWWDNPQEFLHTLFSDLDNFNETNLAGIRAGDSGIFADQSFIVSKIAAIFNIFSFNTFLPCSIFFCVFAFIGLWNFFIFLREEFGLTATLAGFCTIYIPSVLIWDSGIFKDTITFTALLWIFMCGYYGIIKRRKVLKNIIGLVLCGLLVSLVKIYILAAFIPFFILYIFNVYKNSIKNATIRVIATPFVVAVSAACIFFFLQNAGELLGRYSVDQILETASRTSYFIQSIGEAGSSYTLDVDYSSPLGMMKAIPMGLNISMFRPYPWEYAKPFILFASAESMLFLYFTVYLFFKGGLGKTMKIIFKNPIMQFCLLFSLLFAFMVGISSSNFGSLVRYKIPFMPFYLLFLCLLYKEKFGFKKPAVRRTRPPADRPAWARS